MARTNSNMIPLGSKAKDFKLFDTVKVNSNFWGNSAMMKLRTSEPYSSIQSSSQLSPQKFLDNFPRLLNRMVYSRIFSQHPTNW